MDINKLTYRYLTEDDFSKYIELYDSVQTMMKAEKTPNLRSLIISNYNTPKWKHVGVFDEDNKLISTVSGFYPNTYPFWYCDNQLIQTGNSSLSSHIDYMTIFNKSMKLLTDYGEENGYYGFYYRRALSHQLGWEKLLRLALKKGVMSEIRYDYLYEAVYGPVSSTTILNHKFFFPDQVELRIDTTSVIVLYTLKQQFRKELLSRKHPNYFSNQ